MPRKLLPSIPIRYALPGILSVLIAVAVSVTALLSFTSGQTSANEVATKLSEEVAERVQQRVSQFLDVPQQFHEINLASVKSEVIAPDNYENLRRYFWNQAYISKSVPYLYYGAENGDFMGIDTNFNLQGTVAYKIRDKTTSPNRVTYNVDKDGKPIGQPIDSSSYDPRARPWYQSAVKAGKSTWSPIYLFSAKKELGISAVSPVFDKTGKLQGVFGIDLTLVELTNFLRDLKPSPNGKVFIIERDGSVVAISSNEDPYTVQTNPTTNKSEQIRLLAVNSTDTLIKSTGQYLVNQYSSFDKVQFETDKTTGALLSRSFVFDLNGERQLGQITPITDDRGLNWLIVVVIPANDFMARVYENIRTTVALGVVVLIISAVLGYLFASWLIRPVISVIGVADSIEKGDFKLEPLDVVADRTDELGQLGRVFRRMATEVRAREQQLKHQVDQLRIEIDEAKRNKQVEDIVDSDFFKDLSAKAHNMREVKQAMRQSKKEDK